MSRYFRTFLLAMACAGVCAAQTLETRPAQPASAPGAPRALANNEPTYLKLRNIKLGTETVHVTNFIMKREAGTFTFKNGAFQFVEPVNGKITGAVFVGDASFAMTPPIELERRNLAILTKGQPFEEQFSSAVLRFTDGSEEEIRKAGTADNSPAGDAGSLLADVQSEDKDAVTAALALVHCPAGRYPVSYTHLTLPTICSV